MHELEYRSKIGGAIRASRDAVAVEVTNEFLARHPDWVERYGDRARQFGIADAGFHLDFLCAAIQSGEAQAFRDYAEWAGRMLAARQIARSFLAENFEQIGRSFRARLSASYADAVDLYIAAGVEACRNPGAGDEPGEQLSQLARTYIDAALSGYRSPALDLILEAVRQGHSVIDIYCDVLQRAMYRIGSLWEQNKITVAQEHIATNITQLVIAHLYPLIQPPREFRGKIVVTGVQGEFHQVGANMVADALEASGWDVRFLGTDTPISGVVAAVEEHSADILGISATMLSHIPNVARLVTAVRAKASGKIRIVCGGSAFRSVPHLCEELGMDGCALDLRSAVALANNLSPAGSDSPVGARESD